MKHFVIGEDKSLEDAYTAEEVDGQIQNVNNSISSANSRINTLQTNLNTTNTNLNGKQKTISSGTAAPSGGSNGDIYIQY